MAPPHKGKAPTKGSKQILTENLETVNFYRNMSLGAGLLYNLITLTIYYESQTTLSIAVGSDVTWIGLIKVAPLCLPWSLGWFTLPVATFCTSILLATFWHMYASEVQGHVLKVKKKALTFMNFFIISIYVACYQMMRYISRPRYSDANQIIDPGLDLNMEGGMGEHVKDIVIMSSITHVLAILSNYFWLLLLVLPARAFYLLWQHILGPWFFQEAPEDNEQEEKKRKKLERKVNRVK